MKCFNCGHLKKKHFNLYKDHEGHCEVKGCDCNWFKETEKEEEKK